MLPPAYPPPPPVHRSWDCCGEEEEGASLGSGTVSQRCRETVPHLVMMICYLLTRHSPYTSCIQVLGLLWRRGGGRTRLQVVLPHHL